jgi:hypothetical protein
MTNEFEFKTKPSFSEWDEAIYRLCKQLRLASKILKKKGLAERALQLSDQARQLDLIFIEAAKNLDSLSTKQRSEDMVEAIENKAVARIMKLLPLILEGMPSLARQVAAATGSNINERVFKGPATEFFLGSVEHPEEGVGDGTIHRH